MLLAYFIELDGDVHLAIYERFEAELAELKAKQDIKTRANQMLQRYLSDGGGMKAIYFGLYVSWPIRLSMRLS